MGTIENEKKGSDLAVGVPYQTLLLCCYLGHGRFNPEEHLLLHCSNNINDKFLSIHIYPAWKAKLISQLRSVLLGLQIFPDPFISPPKIRYSPSQEEEGQA